MSSNPGYGPTQSYPVENKFRVFGVSDQMNGLTISRKSKRKHSKNGKSRRLIEIPQLVHNYALGVGLVFPDQKISHLGASQHWEDEKQQLISRIGFEKFNAILTSEHEGLVEGLEYLGIPHIAYSPTIRHSDDLYLCDSCNVVADAVFYPRMGNESRRPETEQIRKFIAQFTNKYEVIADDAVFEGGDSITAQFVKANGEVVWISLLGRRPKSRTPEGKPVRTNKKGRQQFTNFLRRQLGPDFGTAITCDHSALHLGTACELIQQGPNKTIWLLHNEWLLNPQKVVKQLQKALGLTEGQVQAFLVKDSWYAPVLCNDGKTVMQAGNEELKAFLLSEGFSVKEIEWYLHQLTDGNLRCAIQPIPTNRWFTHSYDSVRRPMAPRIARAIRRQPKKKSFVKARKLASH